MSTKRKARRLRGIDPDLDTRITATRTKRHGDDPKPHRTNRRKARQKGWSEND